MATADSMKAAILDAIRQVPDDRLADVLSYVRSLSSNGPADPEVYAGVTPGGMSFEIPAVQIKQFLRLLIDDSPEKRSFFTAKTQRSQRFLNKSTRIFTCTGHSIKDIQLNLKFLGVLCVFAVNS
jgi:hypothetical protein